MSSLFSRSTRCRSNAAELSRPMWLACAIAGVFRYRRAEQLSTLKNRGRVALSIVMPILFLGEIANAEVVYDNLNFDFSSIAVSGYHAGGPDRRFAQQFIMGDDTSIESVAIKLQRVGVRATGSLGLELWRDNGSDQPLPVTDANAKIADIGTLEDLTKIPVFPAGIGEFRFADLGLIVEPNTPYWVVLNYADMRGFPDSVAWKFVPNSRGTNGAASLHYYRDADPHWSSDPEFFAMSVETSSSAIFGDFNSDGSLGIDDLNTLTTAIQAASVDAQYDLDGSGVVDLADRQYWVTDLKETWIGDTNLDGVFDTGDLTGVFASGQYEDAIIGNSTWSTGDWNGDGDFDSGDLIAAFSDGGYEAGPRAAVAAVPEPSAALLTLIGLVISAPLAPSAVRTRRRGH